MAWQVVARPGGAGEQVLFKVGLMTFKATSAETNGQFAIIETVLPPGARVEPHQHPEVETFYVLQGEFTFWVGEEPTPIVAGPGAFLCVPPQVRHAYHNHMDRPGRILGMLMPGGDGGLETFFRQVGVPVRGPEDVPDLNQPVEHLQAEIARRREAAPS